MRKLASVFLMLLFLCLGAAGFLYWRYVHRPVVNEPQLAPESSVPSAKAGPSPFNNNAASSEFNARTGTRSEPEMGSAGTANALPVLRSGESLAFDVNVATLNSTIATIQLDVREKRDLAGKSVWHLQAFAHTGNPYRMVFELDDEFDSYSDVANLNSVQYEMHLSERGQKVNSVQRMLPGAQEAAPPGISAARVLPGTRDPLGMLHYLRSTNWSKTTAVRSPVYDGRKLYDVRAVLVGRGAAVKVAAGSYTANKIEIHVYENGAEMKDAHFVLYLANDVARTPVLMEAVLPFATARVELTKSK